MIKNETEIGRNRTGIDLSPIDKKLLMEAAEASIPSTEGDETAIEETRAEYLDEGETIGSMPPPITIRGATFTMMEVVTGTQATVLLDKLGERLAFERTGVRLYSALLGKLDASDPLPGGPTRADLERILGEETAHFEMLREAMLSLGSDPTAITPSADVAAVSSMGLIQVIGDPRMSLKQSLEAILVAELVDNDGWTLLTALTLSADRDELAKRFEQALIEEQRHLLDVRRWISNATIGEATRPKPYARRRT